MGDTIAKAAGSVGSGIGGIAGGIMGREMSRDDVGEARNQAIIANRILQAVKDAPDISKPLVLEQYKQAGVLTPEMEQYITAQEPKLITSDPHLKDAQMKALQQMQQRSETGLTAADRAALNKERLGVQGDVKSRLASIQQQAQMRGQAGGGSDLAAQLSAAQGGANQESEEADRLAQMSQQAREQAVGQLGGLAGQIRGQDFGEQSQQQAAQMEMNRFNTSNQIAQQARNVGSSNQAQASNLNNLQQVSNANVTNQNQEMRDQLNRQMQQAEYNRQNAILKSGGAGALSGYMQARGKEQAQAGANIGAGIGGLMGAGLSASGSGGGGGGGAKGGGGGASAAGGAGAMGDSAGGYESAMGGAGDAVSMFAYNGGQVPNYKQGGQVSGHAQVQGDSPRNDTVHAMLSPGEIVVPRSLAESKIGKEMLKLIHAHNSVKNKLNGND